MPRDRVTLFEQPDHPEPVRSTHIDAADQDLTVGIANEQRRPKEQKVEVEPAEGS